MNLLMEDCWLEEKRPDWEKLREETGFRNQDGLDCNRNYRLTPPSVAGQMRLCDFVITLNTLIKICCR